jgi:HAD superfamily phosphoserine phosphatase-like hydrolase
VTSAAAGDRKWTAVFDVCDTLFSANTTMDFLRFHGQRSGDAKLSRALKRWTARPSPAFYAGALAFRLLHRDIGRTRVIAALRGSPRGELERAARDYVQDCLAARSVQPVHDRLRQHLARGDRVILASSSLDLVIAPVAKSLGVETWIASELGFRDGRCTGRLVHDLTGRKSQAIAGMLDASEAIHVYTDNRSDRDLLKLADRRTVILPGGSRRGRWAGEDCEYVAA